VNEVSRDYRLGLLRRGPVLVSIVAAKLTRDSKETVRARVEHNPKFCKELLREGVGAMICDDVTTAKTILRDYINATAGFTEVAEATEIPSQSLMRKFGPSGNPCANNLFDVVNFLQRREGIRFQVKAASATAQL
jgi:DNA-binding phage protein